MSKTTYTFNLAHNLTDQGFKVLQVDIDPQVSFTIANGIEPNGTNGTVLLVVYNL